MFDTTIRAIALLSVLLASPPVAADAGAMDHDFTVELKPEQGEMHVKDRIRLPRGVQELILTGAATGLQWKPAVIRERNTAQGNRLLALTSPGTRTVELSYRLPLDLPGPGRTGNASDGIVWGGATSWYVEAPGRMHTFTLAATVPGDWRVVSQGARLKSETTETGRVETWRETQPQRTVYLVAAPFVEYMADNDGQRVMAFLRRPDETLAKKYLDLTQRYVGMYEKLVGAYPYAKFALVENSWESGYGMPSFTLMGPRVIRLPFIPYTSYPHEILHNWWGNSVYVDYDTGNWSEGLTTYLADHHLRAQKGEGARYRRDALQKYLDFAAHERDFPLAEFRARHGEASQAIGYSKGMMFFHMLRRRLGDEAFFRALRWFYEDHRFTVAAYSDLRVAFERAGGLDLQGFFDQWLRRAGAPALELDDVRLVQQDGAGRVRGRLRQTQEGAPYELLVPVRVRGKTRTREYRLKLAGRDHPFEIEAPEEPVSLAVDPDFDVFRRLDPGELPPSLGAAFGSARLTFVVPASASDSEARAYESFIAPWRGTDRAIDVITDDAPLPDTGAIWLLGWSNSHRHLLERELPPGEGSFRDDAVELKGQILSRADSTVVLAARTEAGAPLLWAHLANANAARTARRLRHYSRVSYVAFRNGEPALDGQWQVRASPLTVRFR